VTRFPPIFTLLLLRQLLKPLWPPLHSPPTYIFALAPFQGHILFLESHPPSESLPSFFPPSPSSFLASDLLITTILKKTSSPLKNSPKRSTRFQFFYSFPKLLSFRITRLLRTPKKPASLFSFRPFYTWSCW